MSGVGLFDWAARASRSWSRSTCAAHRVDLCEHPIQFVRSRRSTRPLSEADRALRYVAADGQLEHHSAVDGCPPGFWAALHAGDDEDGVGERGSVLARRPEPCARRQPERSARRASLRSQIAWYAWRSAVPSKSSGVSHSRTSSNWRGWSRMAPMTTCSAARSSIMTAPPGRSPRRRARAGARHR